MDIESLKAKKKPERKKIVAGNWKMNLDIVEGKELVDEILENNYFVDDNHAIIFIPPFIQLPVTAMQIKNHKNFYLGAQNCHQEASGAFTGEISAKMLQASGVEYVIIGHSERRLYFGETSEILAKKVDTALSEQLKVIFCVGENLDVRESGKQNHFVHKQIQDGLFHLSDKQFENIVIAYEPIWAIGTGKTATKEQAQEMCAHIRQVVKEGLGENAAKHLSILYGGSCKPSNAKELFSQPDVDGGLIGGASLKAGDFTEIINAL